jgi:hypothetical protein
MALHGDRAPIIKAEGVYFLAPAKFVTPQEITIKSAFFVAGVTFDLDVLKGRRIDAELTNCRFTGKDPVLALGIKGNITQTRFRIEKSDIMGTLAGRIGSFTSVDFSNCYWEIPATEAVAGILGDGEKITEPILTEPVMAGKAAAGTPHAIAAPAMRIETDLVTLSVPPGWDSGGTKAVWKQTSKGSVVVALLQDRMPQGELDTFISIKKRSLAHLDKNIQSQSLEPSLTGKPGYVDFRFELIWEGVPYRVFYHVTTSETHILGAVVTLPASLWEDNEKEIVQMLGSIQRKGG